MKNTNLTIHNSASFVSASEERFFRKTDAETIQAAIDEAVKTGSTVLIPRFNAAKNRTEWRIDKAVVLRSGTRLVIDNARLVQETGTYDHMFTNAPGAEDVAVVGEGFSTLSGGQENRLKESTAGKFGLPDVVKNVMIYLSGAKRVTLENLRIEHQRYHAVVADGTEDLTVRNLDFFAYPHLPNMGGILLKNGTKRVTIDGVTGRTGDDTVSIRGVENQAGGGGVISGVSIRNVLADPARAALVRIETAGGVKIRDVRIDTVMDASRFYEKKRSGAALAFYSEGARPKVPAESGDLSGVTVKNLYSRSERAIAIDGPVDDAKICQLMTFGDNIYAVASRKKGPVELKNVVIERVFYGAGSEPNNSKSFISLQARGAKPMLLDTVSGITAERVLLQDEEYDGERRNLG